MSVQPTFSGEVQFRRWSDSSTQGVQVTFALADSTELEPLKHKAGKRFMAVLVEIGDDEQPVQPRKPKDQRGPLCKEACDLCELPAFQTWAMRTYPEHSDGGELGAKAAILSVCCIESRMELDTDPEAGQVFIQQFRAPFMKSRRGVSFKD